MILYSTFTDIKLTALLKKGDEKAFTEIYYRYGQRMIALAFNYCNDMDEAEEAVQEVFISLWERRDKVEINSLNAYLATSIKFSIFKQLYKAKRRKELSDTHYTFNLSILDEEKIYAKFLQEYIDGIVETFPEKCRLVFQYSRKQQLSNKEIAEEMNISVKTVESHMSKALKILRKNLDDKDTTILLIISVLKKLIN